MTILTKKEVLFLGIATMLCLNSSTSFSDDDTTEQVVAHDTYGQWETAEIVDSFFDVTKARFAKATSSDDKFSLSYWCSIAESRSAFMVWPRRDEPGGLWEYMVDDGEIHVAPTRENDRASVLSDLAKTELIALMGDGLSELKLRVSIAATSQVLVSMRVPLDGFRRAAAWVDESCVAQEPDRANAGDKSDLVVDPNVVAETDQ